MLFEDVFKWFTFCLLVVVVSHPSGKGQLYSENWAEFSEKLQTALNLHCLQLSAVGSIAVTTCIITKVSASSVQWGRCEGGTTNLG